MAAGKIGNIVFYADDPQALSEFWARALGYPVLTPDGDYLEAMLQAGLTEEQVMKRGLAEDPEGVGPRLFFHHADGPKAGRNRMHLDLQATPGRHPTPSELEAEKDRLVELGATVVRRVEQDFGPQHEDYFQMRDPEGNEFCLQ